MHHNRLNVLILPIILFLCPYIYFLRFNQYGYFNVEALCLFLVCISAGLLCGFLLQSQHYFLKVITLTAVITLTLSFFPLFSSLLFVKIAFVLILIFSLFYIEPLISLAEIMGIVFFCSCFIFSVGNQLTSPYISEKSLAGNQNLPNIIHLVLDEHIGIKAASDNLPDQVAIAHTLEQFYVRHGFTVYDNAYSLYTRTYNSLANLLNFTTQAKNAAYFPKGINRLELSQNQAFYLLSRQGYQIRVYQGNYLNFCRLSEANMTYCYTYPVHNINSLKSLNLPAVEKILYLGKSFLLTSSLYHAFMSGYEYYLRYAAASINIHFPRLAWTQDQISTLPTLDVLKKLQQDIIEHPKGNVFFAHLLIPHAPYVYNEHCQIIPKVDSWLINYDQSFASNTPGRRALRYRYYQNQMKCLYLQLNDFFEGLKKSDRFDDAIIIVHGDHSSRILQIAPTLSHAKQLTWQDFQDGYATLYASKMPNKPSKVEHDLLPITDLYARDMGILLHQDFYSKREAPFVYLTVANPYDSVVMTAFPISNFKKS